MMCTRAKMQIVASDCARRKKVSRYLLFIAYINEVLHMEPLL